MDVVIDPDSPTPPYEQLRSQLASKIDCGELIVGSKLPTVRGLAAELDLAVNTVARSYRELESAGLIETRGRAGTVVSARGDERREKVQRAAVAYATAARELGIEPAEALRIVTAALG